MKHGRNFGTISINFEMSLKNVEGFKKFEGENFWDKAKMHPPPGKPEGKNSIKIIAIEINEPKWSNLGVWKRKNLNQALI